MATAPATLQPPPATDGSAPQAPPSAPTAVSPAPATPAPMTDQVSKMIIDAVHGLRAVAQAVPGAAPAVAKINELIRGELMPAIMASQQPGEPAAPPVGG